MIPNIDIRIKNEAGKILFFDYAVEGEIVSSWQDLTNTAMFTLPRKVSQLNDLLPNLIQTGNQVTIRLGYDAELVQEFTGYVTDIGGKVPVEIQCQDLMWKLKQMEVSHAWKKTNLQQVIKKIVPADIPTDVESMEVGDLRVSKLSVAAVLEKLKEMYGIVSFVRNGTLHVGTAYNESWRNDAAKKVYYHFQKNIIDNDLKFRQKKDVKVKLECISHQSNGTIEKYTYPENAGDAELHTLHAGGNLKKAALKKFAQAHYNKFLYSGFRGSFTTFGEPFCDHGFIAALEDGIYPEHDGNYLIDKVLIKFGIRGYRREITLGGKV